MDDRLSKALEHINYQSTINQQKENLKIQIEKILVYACNGGVFTINRDLISFVHAQVEMKEYDLVLLDDKGNPISVSSVDFFKEINSKYHEAMNQYLVDYTAIRKSRSVKALVE